MVKIFSSVKRMFSYPFSACHWRRRLALVRRISFEAGVRRCPFERRCVVMCRSSLMRHDVIRSICSAFGTWSSASRADFDESAPVLFGSGFSPHTFQVFWTSPVFSLSRVPYNVWLPDRWTFVKFSMVLRVWKFENGKVNHSHMVLLDTPIHVDAVTWEQTALAQVPERTVVQKQPSLQPSRLIVSSFGQQESCNRTYGRTMYIFCVCVCVCL